jgi:hypothetical protein
MWFVIRFEAGGDPAKAFNFPHSPPTHTPPQVIGHLTLKRKRKDANSKPVSDDNSICTLLTCSFELCGYLGRIRGRSKTREASQRGRTNDFQFSPNVLVQSAKSGCKRTLFFYDLKKKKKKKTVMLETAKQIATK